MVVKNDPNRLVFCQSVRHFQIPRNKKRKLIENVVVTLVDMGGKYAMWTVDPARSQSTIAQKLLLMSTAYRLQLLQGRTHPPPSDAALTFYIQKANKILEED